MIITVTPNAAVDKTLTVPNFQTGFRHRASDSLTLPGGKDINVARALKSLGQPVVVTGLVGGRAGQQIVEGLAREDILSDIVRISGSTFENNASYAAPDSAPEGGAIYANSAAGLELTDSTFTNNTTDGLGGAIAFDVIGVNSLIDLVTFSNNSAGSVDNPLNYGGSIYLGTPKVCTAGILGRG